MNQSGTTLIEWVIALALNALIVVAVLSGLQASRLAFDLTQQLGELADRGRFIRTVIAQDLRLGGARLPCAPSAQHPLDRTVGVVQDSPWLRFDAPVWGIEAPGTGINSRWRLDDDPASPLRAGQHLPSAINKRLDGQSDVLMVYRLHPQPQAAVASVSVTGVELTRSVDQRTCGIWAVTDCSQAVILQDSAHQTRRLSGQRGGCTPGNRTAHQPFDAALWPVLEHVAVYRWEANAWFVGHNADHQRVLYRALFRHGGARVRVDEMARGVASLQVEYGLVGPASGLRWHSAETVSDWSSVAVVRFGVVVSAPSRTHRADSQQTPPLRVLSARIRHGNTAGMVAGFDGAAALGLPRADG